MIVRHLQKAVEEGRKINGEGWDSTRMLLKGDNVGFSFHITDIHKDAELHLHYQNHFESVYCISGEGSIQNEATGEVYPVSPGTLYVLDKHDKHILRAKEALQLACVFNPPLHGKETHDNSGSYPLEADELD